MNEINNKLINHGICSLLVKIINTLLIFSGGIILARSLGPEEYGLYAFAMSVAMILSIPVTAGLPNLFVREISKAWVKNEWGLINLIFNWGSKLIALYTCLLFIVVVASFQLLSSIENVTSSIVIFGLFFIPLLAILLTQGAALRGMGSVILGQFSSNIINPSIFIVLITIAAYSEFLSPKIAMLLKVISAAIAIVFGTVLIIRKKRGNDSNGVPTQSNGIYKSLVALTLIGGFQLILDNSDILILRLFRTNEEIGIYRVTVQMASVVVFGLFSVNQILHPQFAKNHSLKNIEELQKLVVTSSKIILLIAIPPVLIFIFKGELLLRLFFGKPFMVGATTLSILAFGQLINASFGSVGALLNMSGNESDTLKGMLVAVLVNICLSFLLIPRYGSEGAAFSTAASCLIWNFVLRLYVKKRLGIESCGWFFRAGSISR